MGSSPLMSPFPWQVADNTVPFFAASFEGNLSGRTTVIFSLGQLLCVFCSTLSYIHFVIFILCRIFTLSYIHFSSLYLACFNSKQIHSLLLLLLLLLPLLLLHFSLTLNSEENWLSPFISLVAVSQGIGRVDVRRWVLKWPPIGLDTTLTLAHLKGDIKMRIRKGLKLFKTEHLQLG